MRIPDMLKGLFKKKEFAEEVKEQEPKSLASFDATGVDPILVQNYVGMMNNEHPDWKLEWDKKTIGGNIRYFIKSNAAELDWSNTSAIYYYFFVDHTGEMIRQKVLDMAIEKVISDERDNNPIVLAKLALDEGERLSPAQIESYIVGINEKHRGWGGIDWGYLTDENGKHVKYYSIFMKNPKMFNIPYIRKEITQYFWVDRNAQIIRNEILNMVPANIVKDHLGKSATEDFGNDTKSEEKVEVENEDNHQVVIPTDPIFEIDSENITEEKILHWLRIMKDEQGINFSWYPVIGSYQFGGMSKEDRKKAAEYLSEHPAKEIAETIRNITPDPDGYSSWLLSRTFKKSNGMREDHFVPCIVVDGAEKISSIAIKTFLTDLDYDESCNQRVPYEKRKIQTRFTLECFDDENDEHHDILTIFCREENETLVRQLKQTDPEELLKRLRIITNRCCSDSYLNTLKQARSYR